MRTDRRKQLLKISIGTGPLIFHKRFNGSDVRVATPPVCRHCFMLPELSHRNRASQALFLLVGVLAECDRRKRHIGFYLLRITPPAAHPALTAVAIVRAEVWLIASNLYPCPIKIGEIRTGSDGLRLLHLLFRRTNDWAQPRPNFYAATLRRYSSDGEVQVIEAPRFGSHLLSALPL